MPNQLREKLRAGRTTYGLWVTQESPAITEVAADLGVDWICVDTEHGHLGHKDVLEHVRAAHRSDTTVLVRVPAIGQDLIKRSLDMGAQGVLLPLARSAADIETGVRYARYPPDGVRGIGGERAVRWGLRYDEYLAEANEEILVIPLIETAEADAAIEAILDVPGIGAIFFGPADLSASHGYLGDWEGPGIAERILAIRDLAARRGIPAGIVSKGIDDARRRRDQGFAMVGLGSDVGLLIRQIRSLQEALGGAAVSHRWF